MTNRDAVLACRGVGRGFGSIRVLSGVDLVIRGGDYLAVTGPSGSGKSTLLNLLGLLDQPDEGTMAVDGVETTYLSLRDRASLRAASIGFVFQDFHLLQQKTPLMNAAMGGAYTGQHLADRVARAEDVLTQLGLDQRLHVDVRTLSGGERQRVAIARSLVGRPRVLLADEPTGNLDPDSAVEVLDLFDRLCSSGLAVVVVTHSAQVAERASTAVQIVDGRIVAGTRLSL